MRILLFRNAKHFQIFFEFEEQDLKMNEDLIDRSVLLPCSLTPVYCALSAFSKALKVYLHCCSFPSLDHSRYYYYYYEIITTWPVQAIL